VGLEVTGIYRFDRFALDMHRLELSAPGRSDLLRPTPLRLLAHLIRHRDRIVPRDELIEAVWGTRGASEAALATAIRDVRRALRDDSAHPRFLRTLRGLGYRFVAPVEQERTRG